MLPMSGDDVGAGEWMQVRVCVHAVNARNRHTQTHAPKTKQSRAAVKRQKARTAHALLKGTKAQPPPNPFTKVVLGLTDFRSESATSGRLLGSGRLPVSPDKQMGTGAGLLTQVMERLKAARAVCSMMNTEPDCCRL